MDKMTNHHNLKRKQFTKLGEKKVYRNSIGFYHSDV